MTDATDMFVLGTATAADADDIARMAARRPMAYNDFNSVASGGVTGGPTVWTARSDAGIEAAVLDDSVAMAIAGDLDALRALGAWMRDVDQRLVIGGRADELPAFLSEAGLDWQTKPQWLMQLDPNDLPELETSDIALRIATDSDIPLLLDARRAAVEEEHDMPVVPGSSDAQALERSIRNAVGLSGIAIWTVDNKVAFTAQLVALTPQAASFSDLFTDPALRGEGRATRALQLFCRWLLGDAASVTLRVSSDNDPAIRLYQRLGFTVIDDFLTAIPPRGPAASE